MVTGAVIDEPDISVADLVERYKHNNTKHSLRKGVDLVSLSGKTNRAPHTPQAISQKAARKRQQQALISLLALIACGPTAAICEDVHNNHLLGEVHF